MFLRLAFVIAALAMPVGAQEQTIADVRAELSALARELQALRAELVASGQSGIEAAGGTTALDRMNAIEAEIVRLTARTEVVQNQVERVAADGARRIGDIEFRLCEMEAGCDPSTLPISEGLLGGGKAPIPPGESTGDAATGGPELAVSEQADFDRAKAALTEGDPARAVGMFKAFTETYPGSPLSQESHYLRGEALAQQGQIADAARAYLEAFSGQPDGARAAMSLLRLGQSLGQLGQMQEACLTLSEVGRRFPGDQADEEARATMQNLSCQ